MKNKTCMYYALILSFLLSSSAFGFKDEFKDILLNNYDLPVNYDLPIHDKVVRVFQNKFEQGTTPCISDFSSKFQFGRIWECTTASAAQGEARSWPDEKGLAFQGSGEILFNRGDLEVKTFALNNNQISGNVALSSTLLGHYRETPVIAQVFLRVSSDQDLILEWTLDRRDDFKVMPQSLADPNRKVLFYTFCPNQIVRKAETVTNRP